MCPSILNAMSGMRPNYICFSDPVSSPIHLFDVAQLKGASLKFSLYGITGNGRTTEVEDWMRGCCQCTAVRVRKCGSDFCSKLNFSLIQSVFEVI